MFATRLNSFASRKRAHWPGLEGKPTPKMLIERAALAEGLTHIDLNFPDHVDGDRAGVAAALKDNSFALNGLAMRYYSDDAFRGGAFTNPDSAVRQAAIDLTKRGIDALREMGGTLMTIWPGQDGFDHALHVDHAELWDLTVAAVESVARHDPDCDIAIEYKPNEPRAFSVVPDCATTLLLLDEVGAKNTGVTIDFAHSLYADEAPAASVAHVTRRSRLLGVHLNDGHGKRDDGLMVGAVHLQETIDFLYAVRRVGYAGPLYFDTFPDATDLDPVAECKANIRTVRALIGVCERLEASNAFAEARARQDSITAQQLAQAALLRTDTS
ncbi:MAG: sugar phosphate isomerase/epimerase family protein [Devosia sp.]